jgi:hypothetical protein
MLIGFTCCFFEEDVDASCLDDIGSLQTSLLLCCMLNFQKLKEISEVLLMKRKDSCSEISSNLSTILVTKSLTNLPHV